jgi:hypothetical protein
VPRKIRFHHPGLLRPRNPTRCILTSLSCLSKIQRKETLPALLQSPISTHQPVQPKNNSFIHIDRLVSFSVLGFALQILSPAYINQLPEAVMNKEFTFILEKFSSKFFKMEEKIYRIMHA